MRRSPSVALALALLAALACVSSQPPSAADRDAAITRDDFADWLAGYTLETRSESLRKDERHGIVIVEYHWAGDGPELAARLHSMVYWTHSRAEADAALRSMLAGAGRGKNGVEWRPAYGHLGWAEAEKSYLLVRGRDVVGNLVLARRDNVAVMVMLSGLYSEDSRTFERKVEPMLWQLTPHTAVSETPVKP